MNWYRPFFLIKFLTVLKRSELFALLLLDGATLVLVEALKVVFVDFEGFESDDCTYYDRRFRFLG